MVNAVIRPLLVLLTLPVTVLTLALFSWVINGLLFGMVASFLQGRQVQGFWAAFCGALACSVISTPVIWLIVGQRPPP